MMEPDLPLRRKTLQVDGRYSQKGYGQLEHVSGVTCHLAHMTPCLFDSGRTIHRQLPFQSLDKEKKIGV